MQLKNQDMEDQANQADLLEQNRVKEAEGNAMVDELNMEGSTGNVTEKKKITGTEVTAGTGSNDEVLNINVGKREKKKKNRKSKT